MATRLAEKTVFSYDEATALLPEVRRLTEEAYQEVEAMGGSGGEAAEAHIDQVFGRWAEAMLARGLDVKGLWLVDFDNGSGYYCWRYPEASLMFYHSYEEGFRGRMRIQ